MWRHSRINTRNYDSEEYIYEFGEHFRHAYLKYLEASCSSAPPWVDLPPEITMDILQRVGTLEILQSAQAVCTDWWNVCQDPSMWHVVDLKYDGGANSSPFNMRRVLDKMCRIAVDRSQGQLLKLSIENFGNKDLLNFIAERSSQLRHLRFAKCYNQLAGGLVAAAKNFPLLEELHIHYTLITEDDIEIVGRSCPLLKSFILNACIKWTQKDHQALAIARSMPELRNLALLHNTLTNDGLQAILDGCPHLESLDLRGCCSIELEGDLGRRCGQQIVDLKHPRDSTDDCDFENFYHLYSNNDAGSLRYSDYYTGSPWYFDHHTGSSWYSNNDARSLRYSDYYAGPLWYFDYHTGSSRYSDYDEFSNISFDTIDEIYMDDYHEYE